MPRVCKAVIKAKCFHCENFNSYGSHRLSGSGSHPLWAFATYIIGDTPFPEYTLVLMLDDIEVGYYERQFVYRGHNALDEKEMGIVLDIASVFGAMYFSMKGRSYDLKQRFNFTEGIHIQQRMAGCEMLDNDKLVLILSRSTFNKIVADGMCYNMTQNALCAHLPSPLHKTLKIFLEREKNIVMRKVRPRMRLIKKATSGGLRVSCLAFGFYPRHINLTLLRDGQPIAEQELTGVQLLERHNYTCTVSHLSLDNKLDASWVPEPGRDRIGLVVLSVPLTMMVVRTILLNLQTYPTKPILFWTHVLFFSPYF
uniref:Ig-like domain-containing protein n=1 Tax=Hucho hucho TaxID=62062 RepID=A0A4W5KRL1_9TELE